MTTDRPSGLHPAWTPLTARLVAGVGWTILAFAALIIAVAAAEGDTVLAIIFGTLAGLFGIPMVKGGRHVRRILTR